MKSVEMCAWIMRSVGYRRGLLALCFAPALVWAQSGAEASRLESVAKLIEQSSAGRMFAEVKLEEACARRALARELLEEARQLSSNGGDPEQIDALLDQATREMLAAVRLVKTAGGSDAPAEKEYDKLLSSLEALHDAYVRISSEENGGGDDEGLSLLVKESIGKAALLRDDGELSAGLEVLEGAYATMQAAIQELRNGETLVRTLHFETPADEYAYEIDRNDSLRMLVDVLLGERIQDNARLADQVNERTGKAGTLRAEGEALAGSDRYVEAIASLEASTLELVKAIRGAGVYIPQ